MHARRKFEDSAAYPEDREVWMRWYQQLYDIEDRGRSMSLDERWALRQQEAKPIWEAMENRLGGSEAAHEQRDFAEK